MKKFLYLNFLLIAISIPLLLAISGILIGTSEGFTSFKQVPTYDICIKEKDFAECVYKKNLFGYETAQDLQKLNYQKGNPRRDYAYIPPQGNRLEHYAPYSIFLDNALNTYNSDFIHQESVLQNLKDAFLKPQPLCEIVNGKILVDALFSMGEIPDDYRARYEYFNDACKEGEYANYEYQFSSGVISYDYLSIIIYFGPVLILIALVIFQKANFLKLINEEAFEFVLLDRQFRICLVVALAWLGLLIALMYSDSYTLNPFEDKELFIFYYFGLMPLTFLLISRFILSVKDE